MHADGGSSEAGSTGLSANTFGVPGALSDATDAPTSESKRAQMYLAFGVPGAPGEALCIVLHESYPQNVSTATSNSGILI